MLAQLRFHQFDIEKHAEALDNAAHRKHIQRHLEHLFFAIHRVAEEALSGARHRRKYFEEIRYDLNHANKHPHRYMQRFAKAVRKYDGLDNNKRWHLICHVSNLELKPLRAYFNDKAHRKGDQWQPEQLAAIVSRWFLKQWRVNEEKDGKNKVASCAQVRKAWQKHVNKQDMVAFWSLTDPELTIPPYQSHTNRRPPDCQSLVLNARYLNGHHPEWEDWLAAMKASLPDLEDVASGKGGKLTDKEERRLRDLQLLPDRRKDDDPFRLNAIWGHYHQAQKHDQGSNEHQKAIQSMRHEIAASDLPEDMKNGLRDPGHWQNRGSFAHFLNKYYQSRRRARDGQYFIHPVRGRNRQWHDDACLLTLCRHHPRQKKHQMLPDVAASSGISARELRETLGNRILF